MNYCSEKSLEDNRSFLYHSLKIGKDAYFHDILLLVLKKKKALEFHKHLMNIYISQNYLDELQRIQFLFNIFSRIYLISK